MDYDRTLAECWAGPITGMFIFGFSGFGVGLIALSSVQAVGVALVYIVVGFMVGVWMTRT